MYPGAGVVYPGAGYSSTLGPQLAAAVAGPVRILPQYESFYTNPQKRTYIFFFNLLLDNDKVHRRQPRTME